MSTRLNPYLSFRDNAADALAFYHSIFGGEVTSSTFGEFAGSGMPVAESDHAKIIHAMLEAPNGLVLMLADTPAGMEYHDNQGRITLSLSGEDAAELQGYWDRLAGGGQVLMPLEHAPWGDRFGMLTDKFGLSWMVNVAGS